MSYCHAHVSAFHAMRNAVNKAANIAATINRLERPRAVVELAIQRRRLT